MAIQIGLMQIDHGAGKRLLIQNGAFEGVLNVPTLSDVHIHQENAPWVICRKSHLAKAGTYARPATIIVYARDAGHTKDKGVKADGSTIRLAFKVAHSACSFKPIFLIAQEALHRQGAEVTF